MKNKTKKILDFLTQDVHLRHNYFLIGGILIILALVGYTSYSLFSYEVLSPSIYVSFKDSEKPVCVIGEPAVSLMEKSSTTTFEMNCTDNYTVSDKDLTTSNFTKTGDITVTSVTKEKVGKAMKYIITVTSGTTGGIASIKLNAGAVTDTAGNSSVVSNVSNVYVRVTCDAMSEDVSGANSPEVSLASNMIPVCYNSAADVWVKADSTNTNTDYPWYSYSGKSWANAVTVTAIDGSRDDLVEAEVGTPIPMERINTMLVWIPRFSATKNGIYNGGTQTAPGAFNITFVNKDTTAHEAFTFGEQNLSGIWIGKFRNSSDISCTPATNSNVGAGCNLTSIRPKIKPNVTSWRGAMVSTFFYDILKMTLSDNQYGFDTNIDTTLDTHLMKNNEWGAVAYLTQSIYGRCSSSTSCTNVGINNNSSHETGYGAPAGSNTLVANGTYETTLGKDASTTGNIYGVYDMVSITNEYVMGVYNRNGIVVDSILGSSNVQTTWGSGFKNNYTLSPQYTECNSASIYNGSTGTEFPDSKYYNTYTNTNVTSTYYSSPTSNYSGNMQHALTETAGWYNCNKMFISCINPWIIRSGNIAIDSNGIFDYGAARGYASFGISSRVTLILN